MFQSRRLFLVVVIVEDFKEMPAMMMSLFVFVFVFVLVYHYFQKKSAATGSQEGLIVFDVFWIFMLLLVILIGKQLNAIQRTAFVI